MTEKELKDKILYALWQKKDNGMIQIDTLCQESGLTFSSLVQKQRLFDSLKDANYIKGSFFEGGNGIISITSSGIEHIEELIPNIGYDENDSGLKKNEIEDKPSNKKISSLKVQSNQNSDEEQIYWLAHENYKTIQDSKVPPCFGIEKLANSFIKHLETINQESSNNISMIGIFAPWGRGKTYFFDKVKEELSLNTQYKIKYDIIEFNAWKYQEAPAIWAYMFEKLFEKYGNWWKKLVYSIWRKRLKWHDIILFTLICTLGWLVFYISSRIGWISVEVSNIIKDWSIPTLWFASIATLLYRFVGSPITAYKLIKEYSKNISFNRLLGIQAEIESEIESLLKCWIKKRKISTRRILLYIEDIDRCSEDKMVAIIDSLRTILENDEIRKRLTIICSVDSEKLFMAIQQKYKKLFPNENEQKLNILALEQMDKIFISGLGLGPIDCNQQIEYLRKLIEDSVPTTENKKLLSLPYSLHRKIKSIVTYPDHDSTPNELTPEKIEEFLEELVKNENKEITPRKLRIIFYRLLFANNIIGINQGALFSKEIGKYIFDISIGKKIDLSFNEAYSDVVEMVAPYGSIQNID